MEKKFYQFKVKLEDYKPIIWRQFIISAEEGLDFFTSLVLTLYKAKGGHLAHFISDEGTTYTFYGAEDNDFPDDDYKKLSDYEIGDIFKKVGDRGEVEYDFGDGWGFDLKLEKITVEQNYRKPVILGGEGYGIVDDCGGVYGLEEAIGNKNFHINTAQKTLWANSVELLQRYNKREY